MRTCKSALVLTFLFTTMLSATAQQLRPGLQNSVDPQTTSSIAPLYTAITPRNDVIDRSAKAPANAGPNNLSENSWDFTDPNGVPGFEPMRPNDNRLELMSRALAK